MVGRSLWSQRGSGLSVEPEARVKGQSNCPWARVSEVITELVPARPLIPGPLEAAVRGEKVQSQPLLQNRSLSQIKITMFVDVAQW